MRVRLSQAFFEGFFLLQAIFANSVLANPPFSQVAAGGSPRVPHIGNRIGAQTLPKASYFLSARLSILCRDEKERGERDKDKGKEERTLRFYVPFFFLP